MNTPSGGELVEKTQVNPWDWQDKLGFSQAWRVAGAQSVIFISGQTPLTPDGTLVEGGFEAQVRQVYENLGTVLRQSGASFESIVKLTIYVTDISKLADHRRVKTEFIQGEQPASTAVQVGALAVPGMQIEVEAIALV
ncbi:MAG TPA: RidA family protein [Streptosporangiaceae bacterium]